MVCYIQKYVIILAGIFPLTPPPQPKYWGDVSPASPAGLTPVYVLLCDATEDSAFSNVDRTRRAVDRRSSAEKSVDRSRVECLYRFSVDASEHISELTDAQNLRHDNARPIDLVVPRYIYNTPPTRHDTIRYDMLF